MVLVRLPAVPSPLDLADIPFLREALFEVILLGAAGGLLSAWVVLRRLAFFSHAAGSATFPGLVAADASGVSPTLAGLAVALGYAGGVERTGRAGREPGEATALLLVAALAGGVVLASDVFESGAAGDRLLFGSLLGVGMADPAVAAIPAVGALLVAATYVLPGAAARLVSRTVPALLAWSVALALAEGVTGLYVAYWLDLPPGPPVAVLGAAVYAVLAVGTAARRALRRRTPEPRRAAAEAAR